MVYKLWAWLAEPHPSCQAIPLKSLRLYIQDSQTWAHASPLSPQYQGHGAISTSFCRLSLSNIITPQGYTPSSSTSLLYNTGSLYSLINVAHSFQRVLDTQTQLSTIRDL